ncbi:MAG: MATE family efflux transporter [Clostridia bacterium]|nr:MATE family efflux transporter [Clostridia bacterium]
MEEVIDNNKAQRLNSDKMGKTPILKLLVTMSLPAILSMLVQALYNIMDTVFVGMYYGGLGNAEYNAATQALGLAFPMQMIIVSIGIGVGVGANTCISRKLGEGNREGASNVAKHAILLSAFCSLLLVAVGLTLSNVFVTALADVSGESGRVIEYGTAYLTIVTALSFGTTVEITCSRILQATGNMKIPMVSQAMGALINIALDPLFLFAFGWGVRGAAIATVISQFVSMFFIVAMLTFGKQDVSVKPKGFRFSFGVIREIINVGLPALVTNAIGAVTYVSLLLIMKGYAMGNLAQLSLGLYFKLNSLVFMPVFGLMQGSLPILGYNYGAGNRKRYISCIKLMIAFSLGFLLIGTLLFELLPEFLLGLFSANEATIAVATPAFRIIAIGFCGAAFGITMINAFQSLQCGVRSLLISTFRQFGIIIPFAAVFGQFGLHMVWMAYPVAEYVPLFVFFPSLIITIKKKFREKQNVIKEN